MLHLSASNTVCFPPPTLKSYLLLKLTDLILQLLQHHPNPYIWRRLCLTHGPLHLLTALRTIAVLCAVRNLLLPDAVFICLPVSSWASTDPGLEATAAQDLPTRNQRREEGVKVREVEGLLEFSHFCPHCTWAPSPPVPHGCSEEGPGALGRTQKCFHATSNISK